MTSAAVVARVKEVLGARRVGHTGTLDPMATGVLPVCIGEGTKVAGYLLASDKRYLAELELGVETDTLDAEGTVVGGDAARAQRVDEAALAAVLEQFRGPIQQVPPMFSAVKRRGKRLHQLARAGQTVEREPRAVEITRLELVEFRAPRARLDIECTKGTYVRSLVADIGAALGCGAHLTALRRLRSGAFALADAIALAEVGPEQARARLISPANALAALPAVTVGVEWIAAIAAGQPRQWRDVLPATAIPAAAEVVRVLTPTGALLALVQVEDGRFHYLRVFTYGLTDGGG